jgi:hypothetical protein
MQQLLLELASFRNVDRQDDDAHRARLHSELERPRRSIGIDEVVLHGTGAAFQHAAAQHREYRRLLDVGIALHHRAAEQFLSFTPAVHRRGVVHRYVAPVAIDDLQPLPHHVQNREQIL